ncbi:MAG: type transporter [Chlamydiales bacterium]|nr:type transporter [Chlamydiales bacterium]
MRLGWIGAFTLFRKEVKRFLRVIGQTVFTPIVNSILYILIFGINLGGNVVGIDDKGSYLAFLIPGLIAMNVLNNAFQNVVGTLMISKFHGDLEDLKLVPLTPHQIIWALSLASTLRGLIIGALVACVGQYFLSHYENRSLELLSPSLLMFFLIVGGTFFAQIGICVGLWAKTFEQASAVGTFILMPLIYLGGTFFPLNTLDPFWQNISRLNPLLYYTNGIRYATLGLIDLSVVVCILVAIASFICTYLMALWSVKHGKYSRW